MKQISCIMITVMLAVGCGEGLRQIESEYLIRVSGDTGTAYKGDYTIPGASGAIKPIHVNGIVPMEYRGRGLSAFCMFRKTGVSGSLKIEIMKDKTLMDSKETAEPYGVITIGTISKQEGLVNLAAGWILDMLGM